MEHLDPQVTALQRLCAREGGTQAVADKAGCSEQYIYQIVNGIKLPSGNARGVGPQIRKKLSAAFPDWLKLSPAQNVEPADIGQRRVPLISSVQAGMWTEIVDSFMPGDAHDWITTAADISREAFALSIKGDSMYKFDSSESFKEGDIVIIDPSVQPKPGDFVAARNGKQEATFKKYRPRGMNDKGVEYFELVPLNPDYPVIRSDLEPVQIIGTAVERRSKLGGM